MQALDASLLCAKCEYWRSELAFPWRSKEASRAKGPQSLCHFCRDAGHKAPKVARGHPHASNAPPALPPAIQLAVEQSFPAAQEDAEAEAVLIEVLIARRTVGHQGGASSEHECDLMRRALLLCRGDREAALWRRRGPPSDEVDAIGILCALAPPAWLPEQLTRLLTKEQGARRP